LIEREIDLKGLEYNLGKVFELSKGQDIMAVVKANAYGHGIREISMKLYGMGIREFLISSRRITAQFPISPQNSSFCITTPLTKA
jgi:Alanine racemase